MSTTRSETTSAGQFVLHGSPAPPLEQGDHLDQKTFHARCETIPEGTRAELIEAKVSSLEVFEFVKLTGWQFVARHSR